MLQGTIDSIVTAGTSSPYNGLVVATVTVTVPPDDQPLLLDTQVDVVDHTGRIFDLTEGQLVGVWVWAHEGVSQDLPSGASPGDLTPSHWSATDRVCTSSDSCGECWVQLTQAEYDALSPPDEGTLYLVVG